MKTLFLWIVCPAVLTFCLFILARQRDWLAFWLVIALVGMFVGIALFNLHTASGLRDAHRLYQ